MSDELVTLEDRAETALARALMASDRPRNSKPRPAWINDVPPGLLDGPLPERAAACRRMRVEIESWLADLAALPACQQWGPESVIEAAHPDQIGALAQALALKGDVTPVQLVAEIGRAGGHSIANVFRRRGISYLETVRDVARALDIHVVPHESAAALEEQIVRRHFEQALAAMTEAQRRELRARLEEEARKHGRSFAAEAAAGGAAVLANASGFGVYMLASTAVGAVSHAMGVTLPFVFYTTMSQVIAVAIPGVGVAAAALALYKLGAPNLKKTVPAVLHVAAMRFGLEHRRQEVVDQLRARLEELRLREATGTALDLRVIPRRRGRRRWVVLAVVIGAAALAAGIAQLGGM